MGEHKDLMQAREMLSAARRVVVMSGAGISAESGVPTFRGAGGLWREFRAEDLATPEAFERDPLLVWEWYRYRRQIVAPCEPNPAHLALVSLEERVDDFTLITQNVDGLHRRAGSRRVLEIHGNMFLIRCTGCGRERMVRDDDFSLPPRCEECGEMERPGVVWFGESLPSDVIMAAEKALVQADLFLIVGTSGLVYPAAGLLHQVDRKQCGTLLINLDPTPQSGAVDLALHGKAGELLPALLEDSV